MAFCVLATDEEYQCDIALQIHFTLIQAFCFDNDINVVRVNDIERLADLVGADETGEPKDVHCILVTVSFPRRAAAAGESCMHHHHPPSPPSSGFSCLSLNVSLFSFQSPSANPWKNPSLDKLSLFCEESRSVYDWVPTITLPER